MAGISGTRVRGGLAVEDIHLTREHRDAFLYLRICSKKTQVPNPETEFYVGAMTGDCGKTCLGGKMRLNDNGRLGSKAKCSTNTQWRVSPTNPTYGHCIASSGTKLVEGPVKSNVTTVHFSKSSPQ